MTGPLEYLMPDTREDGGRGMLAGCLPQSENGVIYLFFIYVRIFLIIVRSNLINCVIRLCCLSAAMCHVINLDLLDYQLLLLIINTLSVRLCDKNLVR